MENPEVFYKVFAINVDVQSDFCPGGALAVRDGDLVVPNLNAVNSWTREVGGKVIFTADWHRRKTMHFAEYGGPWPPHCIQNSAGAGFHNDLVVEESDNIARKGMGADDDGYSGWTAQFTRESPLYEESQLLFGGGGLRSKESKYVGQSIENIIQEYGSRVAVIIGGLATDYCVKATVLDALQEAKRLKNRLGVFVLQDAIRAVDVNPGDGEKAIEEMKAAGATFVTTADVINGNVQEIARQHYGNTNITN